MLQATQPQCQTIVTVYYSAARKFGRGDTID